MSKVNINDTAKVNTAKAHTEYLSELQRLHQTYSLIEFIPHAIEITEKYFAFLKGQDKQKMLVDSISELTNIDSELISHMIDLSFYIARNKHFIKLVKKNCKCVYWCSSDNKVISDSLP